MRPRKFGKYGNTDVIKLKPYDKVDMDLKYGDDVDIDGVEKVVTQSKKKSVPKSSQSKSKAKGGNNGN